MPDKPIDGIVNKLLLSICLLNVVFIIFITYHDYSSAKKIEEIMLRSYTEWCEKYPKESDYKEFRLKEYQLAMKHTKQLQWWKANC